MLTVTMNPLTQRQWALLAGFLETRYDVLRQHLDESEDVVFPHEIADTADGLCKAVNREARWSQVPMTLRPHIEGVVRAAKRMWQVDGRTADQVKLYVATQVGPRHLDFVIEEIYRENAPVAADPLAKTSELAPPKQAA
ncbi:MAG: hypothetical protein AAGF99_01095 [Bacteroidota bacterium]